MRGWYTASIAGGIYRRIVASRPRLQDIVVQECSVVETKPATIELKTCRTIGSRMVAAYLIVAHLGIRYVTSLHYYTGDPSKSSTDVVWRLP